MGEGNSAFVKLRLIPESGGTIIRIGQPFYGKEKDPIRDTSEDEKGLWVLRQKAALEPLVLGSYKGRKRGVQLQQSVRARWGKWRENGTKKGAKSATFVDYQSLTTKFLTLLFGRLETGVLT